MRMKHLLMVISASSIATTAFAQAGPSAGSGIDTVDVGTVTVTAIGTTKNMRKIGYSVSQVQGKGLVSSGESGVIQALTGKASNVQITRSTGDPGAGAYIQIRGQNTITSSNQPLIVVDGIPVSNSSFGGGTDGVVQQSRLNDLNPSDIESVEVLKGAAAAAVWGTRAANGVIVVTTKKGKRGMNIEFSSTYAIDQVNREYEKQEKYGQGTGGRWAANNANSWGDQIALRNGKDSINAAGAKFVADDGTVYGTIVRKGDKEVYNDQNREQVFRNGITWNNNLSISAGNDKSNMFFSLSDWNQQGIMKGLSDYRRTTARLNFSQSVNDKLTVGLNANMAKTVSNRIQMGSNLDGLYLGYLRTAPDFDNSDYKGTYYSATGVPTFNAHRGYRRYLGNAAPTYNNPGWTLNEQTNTSDVTRFILTPEATYQWHSNHKLIARLGHDMSTDRRITYFPVNSAGNQANGSFTDDHIQESETSLHFINQGTHKLGSDINLNSTVGYLYTYKNIYNIGGSASQFIIRDQDRFAFINSTTENKDPFNSFSELLNNRVYGLLDFDVKDKIFLQLTGASEASSTYANRFFSPSVSLAYELTKDLKPNDVLSYAKLRMSMGRVGVAPPAYIWNTNFVAAGSYSGWGDYLDGSLYGGSIYRSSTQGNPDIEPEMKTETELGADVKLFENKVSLGVTYYQNKIEGAVLAIAVANSTGYSNQWKNAADLSNKGLEIDLNVSLIKSDDFNLNLYGNLGRNRNTVEDLSGAAPIFLAGFTGASSRAVEGQAMGALWGGKWARDESGKLILDGAGFPTVSSEEGVIGDPNPNYRGGVGLNGNYKRLNFNLLVETCQGNDMWGGTYGVLNNFGVNPESATDFTVSAADAAKIVDYRGVTLASAAAAGANGLAVVNADGSITARGSLKDWGAGNVWLNQYWYTSTGGGFGSVSEQFIYDASWTRIRELSLSCALPKAWSDAVHVPGGISVGFTGRNLALWTKFKGVDPETNLTGVSNGRGLDYFNNPGTKSYLFNIKFNL
ncbi:MAG: SusC/RagA family TonB-linked outer membrane protein [Bacteroidetes bacterium]|nr:SusC/RagA family TonB-linked outer membrane protein [Bacteroidota bacterium]